MSDLELAAEHDYVIVPGGKPMISVTRISSLLDDGKTEALMNWTRRLAAEGKDYEQERDSRGDLGTRVHAGLDQWNHGLAIDALPDEMGFYDAAEKWKIEYQPTNLLHESIVVNRLGFGGRFDDVSEINGEIWGIDYKTGRLKDRENELQHAGYWHSELAVYDDNGMLVGSATLPPITRWASLQLHDDGTYLFQEYPKRRRGQKDIPIKVLQDAAWDKFCKLLDIYVWLHPTKGLPA